MEASRKPMEQDVKPVILNIGCGYKKFIGGINVDGYAACEPDILWNLNDTPFPWDDNSVDHIYAYHVFEHLDNWWEAFRECARILKPGGQIEIRVPDPSSDSAIVYRDHVHIIGLFSFDGIGNRLGGRKLNSWAREQDIVPVVLIRYARIPFAKYNWIPVWILRYLGRHFRNFIWEQRFLFHKIKVDDWSKVKITGHPDVEYLKLMK